ncbi:hypothetical protein ACQ4PT_006030 [Festuca glaucescens]
MPHICAALELNPRCPPFVLAPSAFGSALLIFPSNADRDRAMALGPFPYEGTTVTIVTPEAGEDISTTNYDVIVRLGARKYPLRLWHPSGANFIFGSIGKLCCVDQCSVTGLDLTVIRAFVLLERGKRVPPSAILRMPNNDVVWREDKANIVIVYFDVDNSWQLDTAADAPPPPPPSPRPQTVPRSVSTGTQTDAPASPRAADAATPEQPLPPPTQQDVGTPLHQPLQANGLDAIHLAIDVGDAAQHAADELIAHAEELISSMQALSQDPSFAFAAQSSDQGAPLTPPQINTQVTSETETETNNLPETAPSENIVHTPDPFHAREAQRRRTRARRATEAAAKVRRSQRLAAKQEARFVGMLEVAVKKKAASFDLSAASPSLAAALADTGLINAPDLPATDVDAMRAVARECGATDDELITLADNPVPEEAP